MPKSISLLDRVHVASPCTAPWAEMAGDERVRFCGLCKLNVYNFSEMTRRDVERLVVEKEGKLCGRYYARADGTIITKDCPVGWERVKKRMRRTFAATVTVFLTSVAFLVGLTGFTRYSRILRLRHLEPFKTVAERLDPPSFRGNFSIEGEISVCPPPQPAPQVLLGKVRSR